jgi:short-subunit dehydrogenase
MGTVFITGANRGLGLEFVKEFSEKDYEVIATCRDPNSSSDLTNLAKSNLKIQLHQLDVSNTKNIQDLSNHLKNKPIDILINNAGIYRSGSFNSVNKDSWVESFITNTIGPYEVIEYFLPNVLQGREKKVVSITSKMGSIDDNTSGGSYIYRSSKTALNSMMRSLTHDLRTNDIATMTLHPGWVRTDMGGPGGWIDVKESVSGMINQISNLSLQNTGRYIDYAGKPIKW